METRRQFYPGRPPIDAYGNGGFRFADMSHRGSLLLLPSGVSGWDVAKRALEPKDFEAVFEEGAAVELLILGTGASLVRPNAAVREAFRSHGMRLEPMDTGAAARTYNVLLGEGRRVGAALLAVE
ncbi:MAG: hypothetical protein F9K44_03910 [Hyphomicrobiaceae bacterium]|nr:MAG: hypothetical protein F9K44_03910 [Hyphomicrobiaceae bacterium]